MATETTEKVARGLAVWKHKVPLKERASFVRLARAIADLSGGMSIEDIGYHLRYPATGEVIFPAEFDKLLSRLDRTRDGVAELVIASNVFPLWKRRQFLSELMRRRHNLLEAEADARLQAERDEFLALAGERTRQALRISRFKKLFVGAEPVFDVTLVERWLAHLASWAHFRSPHYEEVRNLEAEIARTLVSNVQGLDAGRLLERLNSRTGYGSEPAEAFRSTVSELMQNLNVRLAWTIAELWEREDVVHTFWGQDHSWPEKDLILKPDTSFHTPPIRAHLRRLAADASTSPVIQRNFLEYVRMLLWAALGNGFDAEAARRLVLDDQWMPMVWNAALSERIHSRTLGSLLENREKLRVALNNATLLPSPSWVREVEPEHARRWDGRPIGSSDSDISRDSVLDVRPPDSGQDES